MALQAGPFDTRQASGQARHVLRLARLLFPAIRVGYTRLVWSQWEEYRLLISQPAWAVWSFFDPLAPMPTVSIIVLHLRTWVYIGKRRRCELTLAYEPSQDVCVVLAESVRVWKNIALPPGSAGAWEGAY